MSLPPRPLRRVLGPLLLLVCFTLTLVLLPVLTVVAAIAGLWMPGRLRAVRLRTGTGWPDPLSSSR